MKTSALPFTSLTDKQFAASESEKQIQVRSAPGMIYFRRADYVRFASALQLSMRNNPNQIRPICTWSESAHRIRMNFEEGR